MLSTRNTRVVVCAWCLFWALMTLIAIQDYRRDGGSALWQPLLWEGSSALVISLLWLVQRRATARHAGLLDRPWRWFALQAAWLPMYWLAFVPLVFGIRHAVYALAGQVYRHDPWPQLFVYEISKVSLFVCLFTVIAFGLQSWRRMLEERLRLERATALLRQAELQRLAQQVQPHFLFNALNTISSLMHTDVDKADATLVRLCELLRATLQAGEQAQSPLAAELGLARAYAEVMSARFGNRVRLDWRVGDELLPLPLPALSLQPLLENVFKHTVEQRQAPTSIAVSALRDGADLLVRVEDDAGTLAGAPADTDDGAEDGAEDGGRRGGVGLANLRARLDKLYGPGATLTLSQLAPAGVRAEMRLPCAS